MALTNLNKLFVRVTEAGLRDAVIAKSKESNNNKIYFLTKTQEIVTQGVAYGLSTDVQAQITNIKSILKSFDNNGHGTEDSVKKAIDAVQAALDAYKAENDAKRALLVKTVAYNANTKSIDFTSENGTTVQTIKASDIIGNHVVTSSSYDAATNKLKLTFGGAEAPVDVDIDLGQMLDMNDVISGDVQHFAVSYDEKKLTIRPVTATVASDTVGLADAKDVKSYVDAAVSGAQDTLQAAIDTINSKLNIIQGAETVEGSINKALKDAKEYADGLNSAATAAITKEVSDRKAADQALYGAEIPTDGAHTISDNATHIASLTDTLAAEITARESADNAEKSAREAAIKEITDALADPATFWEDYTA
jgi:hypothetical protein